MATEAIVFINASPKTATDKPYKIIGYIQALTANDLSNPASKPFYTEYFGDPTAATQLSWSGSAYSTSS
jgi:hypothetical protein